MSQLIYAKGNNGERPPRTAGMRAKTDTPLRPMYSEGRLRRFVRRAFVAMGVA
jgi:hypothetical protein